MMRGDPLGAHLGSQNNVLRGVSDEDISKLRSREAMISILGVLIDKINTTQPSDVEKTAGRLERLARNSVF